MRALLEVVHLSTAYLGEHGSLTGRLDAEVLAAHALGVGRLDLYLQHDRPLREEELVAIRELVRRRSRGEPVAYITGVREFFGRPFRVSPAVLVPRPETEALVERVLTWARSVGGEAGEGLCIADLGTGSGCVAATLAAELRSAGVVATDVSTEALEVARRNAEGLGVADKVDLCQGSWGEALREGATFDAVVSNPPYVTSGELAELERDVRDFEPHLALDGGEEGLAAYPPVVLVAAEHLRAGGLLAVEVDPRRAAAVAALIRARGGFGEPASSADLAGRVRVVDAERTV